MKKLKKVRITAVHYDLEGDLGVAIQKIQRWRSEYSQSFSNLVFEWDTENDGYNDNDEHALYLVGERLETDREEFAREDKEAKDRDAQEVREQALFEQLKKKYQP